jgi:hypothetical protein
MGRGHKQHAQVVRCDQWLPVAVFLLLRGPIDLAALAVWDAVAAMVSVSVTVQ